MSLREDLLSKSKEAIDALKLPFQLRKERKNLESWIITKEESVAMLELKIQEAKSDKNLDIDKILNAIDQLALEQRRLQQGQDLLTELFTK